MSLRIYMDVHVHLAITDGRRLASVDVITAQEDGYARATDPDLLDRATALERVLFSQDEDLLAEAHYRQANGIAFAGVIYGHQRKVTIGGSVRDLELIAKVYDIDDMVNWVQYLPL